MPARKTSKCSGRVHYNNPVLTFGGLECLEFRQKLCARTYEARNACPDCSNLIIIVREFEPIFPGNPRRSKTT